jgi:D-alanyl-lipoteichoic acid acyltransferase DltB (MBOAT superfamily)
VTQSSPARRKAILLVSLAFNLTMLGFFKYYNFFSENLRDLLLASGIRADFVTLNVVLPIGISFYTFITMSYVIDVYRGVIKPSRRMDDFALFVSYFPHLVAGPILRADLLLPQIQRPRVITANQVAEGLWLILWGLFKKVFVADNLAPIADAVFGQSSNLGSAEVLLGVYAFAFQIYGDFSGYSDIARGTSKLMGIELNVNFLFPYFVRSPQAFWRHWHISLSTWLRDYLYIPLGGSRGSGWFTKRNLLLTMLLGGLWHGAAWTYIAWGAYQGLLLVGFRTGEELFQRVNAHRLLRSRAAVVLGTIGMFHLTCYGWLIFRARSMRQIAEMTRALVGPWSFGSPLVQEHVLKFAFFVIPLLAIHALEYYYRQRDISAVFYLSPVSRYAVCVSLFYLIAFFGDFGGAQFIYFRF